MGRGGVPLHGRDETRIEIRLPLRHQAELQRAPHADALGPIETLEQSLHLRTRMILARHDSQARRISRAHDDLVDGSIRADGEGSIAARGVIVFTCGGRVNNTQHRLVPLDPRDIHRKLAALLDELLAPVKRVDDPEIMPALTVGYFILVRLLRQHRQPGIQHLQRVHDHEVGRLVGKRKR